jgi:hypothetical protein
LNTYVQQNLHIDVAKHGFLGDKYGPRNEISGSYPTKVRVTDSTINSEII